MRLQPLWNPRLRAQIQRLASAAASSVSPHAYIGCAATQKSGGRNYPAKGGFFGQRPGAPTALASKFQSLKTGLLERIAFRIPNAYTTKALLTRPKHPAIKGNSLLLFRIPNACRFLSASRRLRVCCGLHRGSGEPL